ncbi:MAG TPA: VTC domain-containing protein [Polyangiaceae bacterium]|nr:VTC domain-containing protein [Polyangiaceae bacterium]
MSQSALVALNGSREGDEQMTAEREETKYLFPAEHVDALVFELNRRLPAHRFTGEGANHLPDPHHFVTTIYFDTPSRRQFRSAIADVEHNVKIRAKEYYDLHPSLAELATDPTEIVRYQPWVWFEVKRREGSRTLKQRFRLPKRDVPRIFSEGCISPGLSADMILSDAELEHSAAGVLELVKCVEQVGEPLRADCLVNYRRLSWQDAQGFLRVTLDLGLSYYSPPPELWELQHALVRAVLGPHRGSEPHAVLEIKRRAALPSWLTELLSRADVRPVPFSKFVASAGAVHGYS